MVLLAATLLVGPWNWIRKKPNPVSSDLRRDLGIWAGILALVHTAVGQCVHLRGRPWLYYVYGPTEHHHAFPLRHDAFGFANYTGAVSALLVIALLATSNDYSLRTLGTREWKKLQRWNYAVFALAGAHALLYQEGIEKQEWRFVAVVIVCIVMTSGASGHGVRSPAAWNQPAIEACDLRPLPGHPWPGCPPPATRLISSANSTGRLRSSRHRPYRDRRADIPPG